MNKPDVWDRPNLDDIIRDHYPEFQGVHPACTAMPESSDEDYQTLCTDIHSVGLKHDLMADKAGLLLDGRTRLQACYAVQQDIRVEYYDGVLDPWQHVFTLNMARRHLTTFDKAVYGNRWREHVETDAKRRQIVSGGDKKSADFKKSVEARLPQPILQQPERAEQTRDKLADKVGIGAKSIDKAHVVIQYAPELVSQSATLSLEAAHKVAMERKRAQERIEKPTPLPVTIETTPIVTAAGVVSQIAKPKNPVFNQTNDSVDWADWTWNPVTGCEHGCGFCYAREIANSARMAAVYPNKFEPTFHEYRLAAPKNTRPPVGGDDKQRRVFVCSMADLFGKWVPQGWIDSVFDACLASPQWQYLFLTKWPKRYSQMPLIEEAWYGASVIQQSDVKRVSANMAEIKGNCTRWVSLEPMLEPIQFDDLSWCDLMVIGSQTSTNQPDGFQPAFSPQFDWVVDVVNHCRAAGVPYYLKANLLTSPGMVLPKSNPRQKTNNGPNL